MRITGTFRGVCGNGTDCPRVLDTDDPAQVLVQGYQVTDAALLQHGQVPAGEGLVRVHRALVDGSPRVMPRDEFHDWYDEHLTRDMLRLETLPYYDPDRLSFAEWQRGDHEPDWERKQPWLDRVRADHQAGITRRRVRIVRGLLTDYERYECQWGYIPLVEHGEDVRILDLTDTSFPLAAIGDFSVFDDVHAIRMHYDEAGVFLGASVVERDVEFFVAVRDLLWQLSEPFTAWWARHPEHHREGAYPG